MAACVDDSCVIKKWIDSCAKAVRCVSRQRRGLHVRARTLENTVEDLEEKIECMYDLLSVEPWAADRAGHLALPMCLAQHAGQSIHFLCLLRSQLFDGAIPSDVWKKVILAVIPIAVDFRYIPQSRIPRVELQPALTMLPASDELAEELLHKHDRHRQQFLRTWWTCCSNEDRDSTGSTASSPRDSSPSPPPTPSVKDATPSAASPTTVTVTTSMCIHSTVKMRVPSLQLVADSGVLLRLNLVQVN